ncbi:histidine--tRNA ligase [Reinekea marinisedimentorum]|uniref:Histidine--tRNA ligase n=1 Tax=Reinekea marinisedimentorum TaxID=230495 RepID=A0A4R3I7J7_9GAMM|nr:histidine--tRNA ligase [Reinekea marinisedimentorum]TCS42007.1 histidyl-tRNA synthetase [Reinekea marinisedimentorum]
MANLQSIRGMNDILPTDSPLWQYLEDQMKSVLAQYGYREIRMPVVEPTELFARGVGEHTDIVEKEMYTFDDRNGDSLTLRPEGTAGCVRAALQHGLLHNQIQRLWYQGPMFRYERPQKGRYRQFYQIGVETFGMAGADIDVELIVLSYRLFKKLGVADSVTLNINTLGSSEARGRYRKALVDYLEGVKDQLDEDSQRRLYVNPLRILDSKSASTQKLLDGAPSFDDYIDEESKAHFDRLCALLKAAGVPYVINPRLVRGLDYYTKSVFEWITDALGAQGTVCAGGRYDGLVPMLGGKPTPASGFAMGIERILLLLQELKAVPESIYNTVDVFMVAAGDNAEIAAIALSEKLRDALPAVRLQMNCGGGSFKSQMKKADKSGARFALILGDQEAEQEIVQVKDLQGHNEQQSTSWNQVAEVLRELGL